MAIAVLGVHRDGGMTSRLSLPAQNLIRADGLGIDACATVEFLAIGAHAVCRAAIGGGERVLVVGAGPIGLGHPQDRPDQGPDRGGLSRLSAVPPERTPVRH